MSLEKEQGQHQQELISLQTVHQQRIQSLTLRHQQEIEQLQDQVNTLQQKLEAHTSSLPDYRTQELEDLNTGEP